MIGQWAMRDMRQRIISHLQRLPLRFFEESLADGGSAGARIDSIQLAAQVEAYNLMRGWTTEGFVSGARRAALGLD